ncbi:hypothetical protein LJC60_01705 [Ruminococcaceae bacterium OttesenSCG-928-D13]|nr:hypothetical protein [Ruminococcaceae bacterium OttesenSCG-928-D13]
MNDRLKVGFACGPLNPELETAAADIDSADIAEMLQWDKVVSIGETVSSKILNLEPDFLWRLALWLP